MTVYQLQIIERAPTGKPGPVLGELLVPSGSSPTVAVTAEPGAWIEGTLLGLTVSAATAQAMIETILDGLPSSIPVRVETLVGGSRVQSFQSVTALAGTQTWVDALSRRLHPQLYIRLSSIIEDDTVILMFPLHGALSAGTSQFSVVCPIAGTISAVYLSRITAGSSGSTTLDVNKNGTTLWTTAGNRPQIAYNDSDNKVAVTLPDVVSLAAGDLLTLDVDTVEAGSPADLTLVFAITPT